MAAANPVADFDALLTRLGFNAPTIAYLVTQGIDTADHFAETDLASFDTMIKLINKPALFPVAAAGAPTVLFGHRPLMYLKAFRAWVDYMMIRDEPVGTALFTPAITDRFTTRVQELSRLERSKVDATSPGELLVLKNFNVWEELFATYLRQYRSVLGGTPLTYVTRPGTAVTPAQLALVWPDIDDELIETASHNTATFRSDNGIVYDKLKPLIVNGEGWAFIQGFDATRNGRAAFLALKSQAEGPAAVTTRKNDAYTAIAKARYTGQSSRFTYDMYVSIFQKAFNELHYLGEPVHESKKVDDFLRGITASALQNAKDHINGDDAKLNSFEQTHQYIKTVLVGRARQPGTPNVSAVQTATTTVKRRTPSGKNVKGKAPKKVKPRVHAGHYTSDEWGNLADDEKQKVRDLRTAKKQVSVAAVSSNPADAQDGRTVSAVSTDNPIDEVTAPTAIDVVDVDVASCTSPSTAQAKPAWYNKAVANVAVVATGGWNTTGSWLKPAPTAPIVTVAPATEVAISVVSTVPSQYPDAPFGRDSDGKPYYGYRYDDETESFEYSDPEMDDPYPDITKFHRKEMSGKRPKDAPRGFYPEWEPDGKLRFGPLSKDHAPGYNERRFGVYPKPPPSK